MCKLRIYTNTNARFSVLMRNCALRSPNIITGDDPTYVKSDYVKK